MKRHKLNSKFNHGTSLIEVLIALLIMSGLLISVYIVVDASTKNADTFIIEDEDFLSIEAAMERIRLDFSQIYTPLYYSVPVIKKRKSDEDEDDSDNVKDYVPTDTFPQLTTTGGLVPEIYSENPQEISFFMSGNKRKVADQKQSHFAWVKYSLREYKPEGNIDDLLPRYKPREDAPFELVRQYVADNPYREELQWEEVKQNVMLRHIRDFKITFWDEKRRKFVDNLKQITRKNKMLRAIRLEMSTVSLDNFETKTERIFMTNWPLFDAQKDQKERESKLEKAKKKNQTNSNKDSSFDSEGGFQ
ncbi:MAG: hypothetical protein H6622_10105 [Halobacteriovoraceae bacterium]|nr:hypothetical protein [Halobacteriovoraceae bacterium]